jgi:hypothetical protein
MKYLLPAFGLLVILSAGALVIQPAEVHAAVDLLKDAQGLAKDLGISRPKSGSDRGILDIIIRIVNYLLGLVAVLALAAMVWASVMYIVSLGDEKKVEHAKGIIMAAIIGVLLSGLSFLILRVLKTILIG